MLRGKTGAVAQVSGAVEIGPSLCGNDTSCPVGGARREPEVPGDDPAGLAARLHDCCIGLRGLAIPADPDAPGARAALLAEMRRAGAAKAAQPSPRKGPRRPI